MRRIRAIGVGDLGRLSSIAAGCSGQPKLVPVTGTVKLDGKAGGRGASLFLAEGSVGGNFVNQFGIGFSDKEGKFSLRGTNGDGVATGEYKVTFARPMTGGGKDNHQSGSEGRGSRGARDAAARPDRPETDQETATVSPRPSTISTFDLSTK